MAQHHEEASNFWDGTEIISTYSRAEAIRDGALVDVSETAREAGITVPVAMTQALHAEAVAWNVENRAGQDEAGRLWDVLTMTRYTIARARGAERAAVTVLRVPNTARALTPRPLEFTAHIGPGDNWEPVLTLMLPHED